MAISPFQWGPGNQAMTPGQAKEARSVAAALAGSRARPAANGWEGLVQVANALSERGWRDEAAKAEAAGQSSVAQALAGLGPNSTFEDLSGVLANPWVTESPGASTIASALLQRNLDASDPLKQLQLQQAQLELEQMRNPAPQAPELVELYDEQTGLPYKAAWDGSGWQRQGGVKAPSGTSLSVDPETGAVNFTTGSNGRFDNTVDAGLGKAYTDIQTQGLSAVQGLDTLAAMEQTMEDPNFYSGFGGEQVMALKQAAAAAGINPDGVTSMETFNALSKQAALASMGGSLGAGFSNADRSFVEQQVASLSSTPAGNKALIQLQRKILSRKVEIADLANRYKEANGKIDGGFTKVLSEYAERNPLFGEGRTQGSPTTGGVVDAYDYFKD